MDIRLGIVGDDVRDVAADEVSGVEGLLKLGEINSFSLLISPFVYSDLILFPGSIFCSMLLLVVCILPSTIALGTCLLSAESRCPCDVTHGRVGVPLLLLMSYWTVSFLILSTNFSSCFTFISNIFTEYG